MKMYIFRKENDNDYERVEIEVIQPNTHSLLLKHNGEVINLKWDEEYDISEIQYDDLLCVYILGDDFSQGHLMPFIKQPMNNLSNVEIYTSKLEKLTKKYEKTKVEMMQVLEVTAKHLSGTSLENLEFLRNLGSYVESGNKQYEQAKEILDAIKTKKEKQIVKEEEI